MCGPLGQELSGRKPTRKTRLAVPPAQRNSRTPGIMVMDHQMVTAMQEGMAATADIAAGGTVAVGMVAAAGAEDTESPDKLRQSPARVSSAM